MAGKNEAFRICSSVSEALSYMPCPLQYTEPNTKNDLWVFWSQHNNEFPTVFPSTAATTIYHDTIKEKIVSALKNAYISDNYGCWLVQFWAHVTTKGQIFLTTCDLPFGLTKLHEGLCYYRSECLKVRIPIVTDSSENEYRLGPTGRVFKHGLPEMSPDVSRYSVADFPLHGSALTAGLGNYLAVPVFEPLSNECAGVLEIIGDKKGSFSQDLVQMIYEMLKGLRGLERALKEIEDQLNFLCRTHQLPLAQTWLPILDGSNVERFTTAEEQFCICTSAGYEFRAACDMFHLGKSQGVVGRAFLSHSSCFCSDITELRMSEYPLAHVAHRVGLHSSFAICLQSSYTGDYVYLLEFFLPQDNKSDCRSPQTMLNMLLASMKRQFRSFKLASGQKLGEKLSVEIIPVPSDDGLNSFEICHSVKPFSDIEAVARPGKIEWFDPLNRLLKSGNTANICPENIDLTTSSRTANTTTKLTNVRVLTNRVFSNSSEEESMMKISERHHRINSVVLQQSVGAKVNGTETTLASQSAPNSLGTKHFEINDMNCSSDQLESAKVADRHCEESSGGDQLCHDTTTSLTHAAKPVTQAAGVQNESTVPIKCPKFLLSGVRGDELERLAKVSKFYDREELQPTGSNENHESGGDGEGNSGKSADQPAKSAEQPKDYIHVRARRGQATDSRSLADRARREKIRERMQLLQELVPGCYKVIGKAFVLDEIINYVHSLQRQVEFLSMKLEAVNTRVPPHIEGFPTKDLGQQAFEANAMAFDSQGTREYAGGTSPDWLHMQIGGGFERR